VEQVDVEAQTVIQELGLYAQLVVVYAFRLEDVDLGAGLQELHCARLFAVRGHGVYYMYDFIGLLGPHLTRRVVDHARACSSQSETDALFDTVELPTR
jgi:hypothetical protein